MAFYKSANPALPSDVFIRQERVTGGSQTMTISGTVNKIGILLAVLMVAAYYTFNMFNNPANQAMAGGLMLGGLIVGLILALIITFKKTAAPVLAPIYALVEGVVLGGFSAFMEMRYTGIATQAMTLTFGIFIALLLIYKMRLIKVTENFKLIVASATGGIFIFYLISMIAGLFHVNIPLIHSSGIFGIGFSVFVVAIASVNLVVDFDFIEQGEEHGAPKYMEWYGAFGLLVTLVWLYIEILRLLAKLRSRN
jgi:uncharacterized YccA/Bax inhibitor family protein